MTLNRKKVLSGMTEEELISVFAQKTFSTPEITRGIGDDTAVLRLSDESGKYVLLTQDSIVSGRHFDVLKDDPYWIGWKALARNLSDIAAMAGKPSGAVVALGIPGHIESGWLEQVYDGINACAQRFSCPVIGGDISSSQEEIFISITVIGTVSDTGIVYRNGARPGNLICVTGTLGGSIMGRHLTFLPRIEEVHWFRKKGVVTALIDVSDGLAKDLFHIAQASNVGFDIEYEKIPVSDDAIRCAGNDPSKAFAHALHDGEDFELLFTIDMTDETFEHMASEFEKFFGIPCTCIGKILEDTSQANVTKNGVFFEKMKIGGFDHFRDS